MLFKFKFGVVYFQLHPLSHEHTILVNSLSGPVLRTVYNYQLLFVRTCFFSLCTVWLFLVENNNFIIDPVEQYDR